MKRKKRYDIRTLNEYREELKIIKSVYRKIESVRKAALLKGEKMKVTTIIRRLRNNDFWSEKMKTQQNESWRTGFYRYMR